MRQYSRLLTGFLFLLLVGIAGCGRTATTPQRSNAPQPGSTSTTAGPVVYLADSQLARSGLVEQVEAIQGGKQRWAFVLSASGSALTLADGTVYVGAADTLFALDAATGHKRWSAPAGPHVAKITVVQGLVYVDSGAGGFAGQEVFYAFNTSDGTLRWRFTPSTPLGILAWLVDGGIFYAAEAGFPPQLVAADAATGTLRWQVSLQQVSGQITALLPGDATSLVLVADQTLMLVQRSTGAQVWRHDNTHSVGLQVFADTIYTFYVDRPTSIAAGSDLVGLRALKVADGSVLWSQPLPDSDSTYLGFQKLLTVGAITPEGAYLIDGPNFGDLHAWDVTGRLLWMTPGSDTYRVLAANDQAIFVASAHGVTALMGATGKTRWHVDTPTDVATMQMGTGGLYGFNTSHTRVYAFAADTGKLLWTFQANQIDHIVT